MRSMLTSEALNERDDIHDGYSEFAAEPNSYMEVAMGGLQAVSRPHVQSMIEAVPRLQLSKVEPVMEDAGSGSRRRRIEMTNK